MLDTSSDAMPYLNHKQDIDNYRESADMTIVEYVEITQAGYRVTVQYAKCRNCTERIERAKPARPDIEIKWGHVDTGRSVCILPADASKVATPA